MKILVVATLLIEKESLANAIQQKYELLMEPISFLKKTRIFNTEIKEDVEVALLDLEQIGNVEAGIKTYRALNFFKPDLVILTGICGGFQRHGNLKLGDIIIPERIIYYELGKVKKDEIERRFSTIEIDNNLVKSIKRLTKNKSNVIFKSMLTGEKVIADENFYLELSSDYPDIVATEMESYGTYQAISASGLDTDFLVIKSIGDWADFTKSDSYQKTASKIASEFVISLIENMNFKRKNRKQQRTKHSQ